MWPGYRKMLDSKVADISSTGEPGAAGSITAALFLQEFAKAAPAWVHIDTAGAWGQLLQDSITQGQHEVQLCAFVCTRVCLFHGFAVSAGVIVRMRPTAAVGAQICVLEPRCCSLAASEKCLMPPYERQRNNCTHIASRKHSQQ